MNSLKSCRPEINRRKSISVSWPLSIKQTAKLMNICSVIIYPLEKKISLEQAAFWHEVKVLCCLLIPFLLIAYARCFNWNSSDFPQPVGKTANMSFLKQLFTMPSHISSTPSNVPMTSAVAQSNSSVCTGIWHFQFPSKKWKRTWCVLGLFGLDPCHLRTTRVPDHAPIVIVIQSEHLKHSISPRNQSAKHPDSGCFGIRGVV